MSSEYHNGDWWRSEMGLEDIREQYGTFGEGKTVAVLDSGLDPNSRVLYGNRIIMEYDFFTKKNKVLDDGDKNNHGTHILGFIGAKNDKNKEFGGIAPKSNILLFKVYDSNSSPTICSEQVAKAIEMAVNNGADLINISQRLPVCSEAVHLALIYAVKKGVIVISLAGNDDDNGGMKVNYPGAYQETLTVGSYRKGGDGLTTFSSSGQLVDMVAPGKDLISYYYTEGVVDMLWGTSYSAALVSGFLLLFLSHTNISKDENIVYQIKQEIQLSCKPRKTCNGRPCHHVEFGYGDFLPKKLFARYLTTDQRTVLFDDTKGKTFDYEISNFIKRNPDALVETNHNKILSIQIII